MVYVDPTPSEAYLHPGASPTASPSVDNTPAETSHPVSENEYCREIMKQVICEFCLAKGFSKISPLALSFMIDVAEKYISRIGLQASSNTEQVGRTDSNAFDVSLALSEFGITTKEMKTFLDSPSANLFEIAVPNFPLKPKPKMTKKMTTLTQHNFKRPAHISSYLPPFPPDHTFFKSAIYEKGNIEKSINRAMKSEESYEIDKGLARFLAKKDSLPSTQLHAVISNEVMSLEPALVQLKNSYVTSVVSHNGFDLNPINEEDNDHEQSNNNNNNIDSNNSNTSAALNLIDNSQSQEIFSVGTATAPTTITTTATTLAIAPPTASAPILSLPSGT